MSKIRMKLGDLKRLIESRLAEDDAPAPEEPKPFKPGSEKSELGDSLDAQVDRFLNEYEEEARNSKNEGLDLRLMIHRMIREADEEIEGPPAEKRQVEDIDIESFANSVARLIENFENLIETKNAVIRRACNHLLDRYDPSVKTAFEDALREQHGLADGVSKEDVENDFDAPAADRAGPALPGEGGAGPA